MLAALPTIYDLTDPSSNLAYYDPTSNLAAYDAEYGQLGTSFDGMMPAYLADNRFLMGAEYAPALFAGAYGYRRHRSILPTLAWALAGYMAPLPVAGLIAFEAGTGQRAFGGLDGLDGLMDGGPVGGGYRARRGQRRKCIRWGRTADGRRVCRKYGKA